MFRRTALRSTLKRAGSTVGLLGALSLSQPFEKSKTTKHPFEHKKMLEKHDDGKFATGACGPLALAFGRAWQVGETGIFDKQDYQAVFEQVEIELQNATVAAKDGEQPNIAYFKGKPAKIHTLPGHAVGEYLKDASQAQICFRTKSGDEHQLFFGKKDKCVLFDANKGSTVGACPDVLQELHSTLVNRKNVTVYSAR